MPDFLRLFDRFKAGSVCGRYVTLDMIEPILTSLKRGRLSVAGHSVQNRPIYKFETGSGPLRVLAWSQMHGNESTATKALMDVLRFLESDDELARVLMRRFTFCFVPMLNPDGAQRYTRVNVNEVDLNRDFNNLSEPETRAIHTLVSEFGPDFCLNLHDQRSIFGIAQTGKPAVFSVLAPAFDAERNFNTSRKITADLAARFALSLKEYLPGSIGRFDDAFNSNCAGDHFQSRNIPTVLIETGHAPGDYDRETVRKWLFVSLIATLADIAEIGLSTQKLDDYLKIPQNSVLFFDFVYKNVRFHYDGTDKIANFAAHYSEVLKNGRIQFEAQIVGLEEQPERLGHFTLDAKGELFASAQGPEPMAGNRADFTLGTKFKIVNGLPV